MTASRKSTRGSSLGLRAAAVAVVLLAIAAVAAALPRPVGTSEDAAPPPDIDIRFTDVTVEAGLSHSQADERALDLCEDTLCMAIAMSGGAAIGDVDGDGYPDLLMTRSDAPPVLYRNRGDGTFEDGTAGSGLDEPGLRVNGAAWADVDNDGDQDLYLTSIGPSKNHLFINRGDGTFVDEATERGADLFSQERHQGQGVAVGDYDNDGWLDIYASQWGRGLAISNSRLLRNKGPEAPGSYEDVTHRTGFSMVNNIFIERDNRQPEAKDSSFMFGRYSGKFAFAPAFADLDGDGWQDLAIAADFGTSRLFWNDGAGGFIDGTEDARVGTDENGMGSAIGDVDGDGRLDWFVSSIYQDEPDDHIDVYGVEGISGNRLYRNAGDRTFEDATDAYGVRQGYWGWGASWLDADNDGDLDLVQTNGMTMKRRWGDDPTLFWRNDGGTMTELAAAAGFGDRAPGKGLVTFDLDMDGDQDVLIVNTGRKPILYRNDTSNGNGWLRVKVRGTASNRDGIGAKVRVRAAEGGPVQYREIGVGSHFIGQSERIAHFGLGTGDGPVAEVTVLFPATGKEVRLADVGRNSVIEVVEPE